MARGLSEKPLGVLKPHKKRHMAYSAYHTGISCWIFTVNLLSPCKLLCWFNFFIFPAKLYSSTGIKVFHLFLYRNMPMSLLANLARLNKLRGSRPFLCIGPSPKTDGSLNLQNKQAKIQKNLEFFEVVNCTIVSCCSPIFAMCHQEKHWWRHYHLSNWNSMNTFR